MAAVEMHWAVYTCECQSSVCYTHLKHNHQLVSELGLDLGL